MIKLTSFYPFSNFLKITNEFHNDKVVVKMKSLTHEYEFELSDQEITKISCENNTSRDQRNFSSGLIIYIGFIFVLFFNILSARPILYHIMQVLYTCTAVLFITSFVKQKYYYFSDKTDNIPTSTKVTRKNYNLAEEVIELIKNNSKDIQATSYDKPFPESKPAFELVEHNIPNYFNKSTVRFYENELICHDKSMAGESVDIIKYNELSGEVCQSKQSNGSWGIAFWMSLVVFFFIAIFDKAFYGLPNRLLQSINAIFVTIFVVTFLLQYVKQEIIGLYDKNDKVVFRMWLNKSNQQKIEEIKKFIQSRIPAENKEVPLKE